MLNIFSCACWLSVSDLTTNDIHIHSHMCLDLVWMVSYQVSQTYCIHDFRNSSLLRHKLYVYAYRKNTQIYRISSLLTSTSGYLILWGVEEGKYMTSDTIALNILLRIFL